MSLSLCSSISGSCLDLPCALPLLPCSLATLAPNNAMLSTWELLCTQCACSRLLLSTTAPCGGDCVTVMEGMRGGYLQEVRGDGRASDGRASAALTPCQLSGSALGQACRGRPVTYPWAWQTCLALQDVSHGWVKASPFGQAVYQCDLWVTSLPLCGLGCWLELVDMAHHPGC